MLNDETADVMARNIVSMIDLIHAFYTDPRNEAAYQTWLAGRTKADGH